MATKSPTPSPVPAKPVLKSRVVVVETISHVPIQGEPTVAAGSFARFLESEEQPYRRAPIKVGPDWTPLDLGWLEDSPVAQVILVNQEGTGLQTIPTPEERAEIRSRVVEVSLAYANNPPPPGFLVRPGESFRAEPDSPSYLVVRCRSGGTARCYLLLIPG